MSIRSLCITVLCAALCISIVSCSDLVGSDSNRKNSFHARVPGAEIIQDWVPFGTSTYENKTHKALLFGIYTCPNVPMQTLSVGFTYDLDKGTYPATLMPGDCRIILTVGQLYGYMSADHDCTVTLGSWDGHVVKGTFSGTLYPVQQDNGPSLSPVTVTDGEFSMYLMRK